MGLAVFAFMDSHDKTASILFLLQWPVAVAAAITVWGLLASVLL